MRPTNKRALKKLFRQIRDGASVEVITETLDSGIDVNDEISVEIANTLERYGLRAITVAAQSDRMDIVELLLARGAEASCSANDDGHGDAPINAATRNGNLLMVQMFIDREVDMDAMCDIDGAFFTPLQIVSSCRDYEYNPPIIQALVRGGASITNYDYIHQTILNCAVEHDDLETTKVILDQLSELGEEEKYHVINELDEEGKSPVHSAVESDNLAMVELLVDHGVDIDRLSEDFSGNESFSPLYRACNHGSNDIIDLLLDRGAQINWQEGYEKYTIELMATALQRESRFNDPDFLFHFNDEKVQDELSFEEIIFFTAAISNAGSELPEALTEFAEENQQEVADFTKKCTITGLTKAQQNMVMASGLEIFCNHRKLHTFLAVIMPQGDLRDEVINRFNSNEVNQGAPLNQEKISKLREYREHLVTSLTRSLIANKEDSFKIADAAIETLLTADNLTLAREYIIQNHRDNRSSILSVSSSIDLTLDVSGTKIMPLLNERPNPLKQYPATALDSLKKVILGNLIAPPTAVENPSVDLTVGVVEQDSSSVSTTGKRSRSEYEEEKAENKKLKYSPTPLNAESLSSKRGKDRS